MTFVELTQLPDNILPYRLMSASGVLVAALLVFGLGRSMFNQHGLDCFFGDPWGTFGRVGCKAGQSRHVVDGGDGGHGLVGLAAVVRLA